MKNYYLAHSTNSRKIIRQIELQLEKECNVNLINPFYDTEQREIMKEIDAGTRHIYNVDPHKTVKDDLKLIKESDGLVGILDDTTTIGTYMEIMFATENNIPNYLLVMNGHHNHPFLRYCADKMFTNINQLKRFLTEDGKK